MSKSRDELAADITAAWLHALGTAAQGASSVLVANAAPEQVAEFYKTVWNAVRRPAETAPDEG